MKSFKLIQVSLALVVMAVASTAHATAFYLGNQGARSMGRANAVVADPKDASTVLYNPAGMAALDGTINAYAGAILINYSYWYQDFGGGPKANDDVNPLVSPHAYITGRVTPWLTLGFGLTPSYGATVKWGADSPGRTLIREQSARTLWFMPAAALDFSTLGVQGLSIAAALDLVHANAFLSRDVAFGNTTFGSVRLSGSDFRVGGHFGLLYKPDWAKGFSLGAMYHLPVRTVLTGNADFDAPAAFRGQLPPDGKASVDGFDIPQMAVLGLGYTFCQRFNLEVDGVYHNWKDFERLSFKFPAGATSVSPRLYEDRFGVRAGGEWRGDVIAVRAGYEYDPSPIPTKTLDFTLPDINRHNLSAGLSVFLPANFWVDLGGWMLVPGSRDTERTPTVLQPIVGTYHVSAWELGLSVGWKLAEAKKAPPAAPVVTDAPLRDTDSDGVPDATDACPAVAGNDGKGCPLPVDADNDGVMDDVDKCPGVAGVPPDGCPPPDPDKDGVAGDADACPNEPGDMPNGCPNPDPDGDGIAGDADKCPKEPETKNGFQDTDGCPDELPAAVAKFNGKLEGVKFGNASSRLASSSFTALNAIAATLKEYPDVRLEISGHTDNVGSAEKNLVLSQKRADSVRDYLVSKGVAADRIQSIGYGADRPVADNATKEGQAANRRIEFKVLQ